MASLEGVMHGLYLVWLVQERGFSPALVATVLAAGDLCVFLLEVPTGWVADRLGHRVSLMAGSFVQIVGMLTFWLAASAPTLLAASLLVALGDAFRSGADEALLVAGGGIVAVAGYPAAWMTEMALSACGLVLACLMVEPPAVCTTDEAGAAVGRSNSDDQASWRSRWRLLVWLVLPGAGADLLAAITLSEAAGAWLSSRVWRHDGRLHLLLACGAAILAVSQVTSSGAAAAAVALASGRPPTACARESRRSPARAIWPAPRSGSWPLAR